MTASVQAAWLRSPIRTVLCAGALFLGQSTVRAQESPNKDAVAPSEASSVPEGTANAPEAPAQAAPPTSPEAVPAPEAPAQAAPPTSPEAVPAPLPDGEQSKPVYPRPYTRLQPAPSNREGPPQAPGPQPPAPHEVGLLDEPDEPDLDAFRHRGFFLRLTSGIGAGATRYHEPVHGEAQSVQTRGVSTLFELALGYAPIPNLIVHGSAAFLNIYESRREVAGQLEASPDIESGCALLGAGATYYFMPANVYITATAGVAGFSESRRGRLTIDSRAGVGGSLSLGKEWWIGRTGEWAVGAALRGSFNSMKAQVYGELERVYVSDIGLVFSATMN